MACAALQNTDCIFEISFHSEMGAVKQITRQVLQFLGDNIPSLSEDDVFDLRLIYSELLINAVSHGNKMDSNKSVHLFVEAMDNIVYSVISDEGFGFEYTKVPAETNSDKNLMKETGRGIRLAGALTDSLSFKRPGSQVTFYKQVGRKDCSSKKRL